MGVYLLNDGIFACSFIKYIKGAKNYSGMVESMMYNQFEH